MTRRRAIITIAATAVIGLAACGGGSHHALVVDRYTLLRAHPELVDDITSAQSHCANVWVELSDAQVMFTGTPLPMITPTGHSGPDILASQCDVTDPGSRVFVMHLPLDKAASDAKAADEAAAKAAADAKVKAACDATNASAASAEAAAVAKVKAAWFAQFQAQRAAANAPDDANLAFEAARADGAYQLAQFDAAQRQSAPTCRP